MNLLASEKEDTLQVNIYQHLTNSYFNDFKFDSARLLATQGLELAQKIGYKKGEMRIKSLLARLSYSVGDFATAIELDYSLLEYAILMHDTDLEHAAYINITNTYRDQGEYREALTFMWKLMNNDSIYYDCSQCGIGYSAIGSNYYGLKMYDSALYYANKGLAYPKDFSYGWQLLMKGRVLEKLNQYKEAFDYFHRSIAELRNNGYSKDLAGVYSSIGDLFIKINQTDSAIYYGNLALDLAYKRSYNKELLEAYLLLAKANEQINKSDALQYYRRAMNLKDSLFNKDKQKQISSARFNEILRQNEIKNSEAEYKNQLRFNALIGSTFTLIIIAIFLFWNNRAKQIQISN